MGGISRAGNERLRVLLVIGATSVIKAAVRPGSKQMTDWLRALLQRKPRKVAAVALANKMARVAWALMMRGNVYRRRPPPPERPRHDRRDPLRGQTSRNDWEWTHVPRPSIGETAIAGDCRTRFPRTADGRAATRLRA
jgi:hypothetical protein